MKDLIIKITIPEKEYISWEDYEKGGIQLVKTTLINDFKAAAHRLGINCSVEIVDTNLNSIVAT